MYVTESALTGCSIALLLFLPILASHAMARRERTLGYTLIVLWLLGVLFLGAYLSPQA